MLLRAKSDTSCESSRGRFPRLRSVAHTWYRAPCRQNRSQCLKAPRTSSRSVSSRASVRPRTTLHLVSPAGACDTTWNEPIPEPRRLPRSWLPNPNRQLLGYRHDQSSRRSRVDCGGSPVVVEVFFWISNIVSTRARRRCEPGVLALEARDDPWILCLRIRPRFGETSFATLAISARWRRQLDNCDEYKPSNVDAEEQQRQSPLPEKASFTT